MHLSIIDFCFGPKLPLPINCSHKDNRNSDFNMIGLAPSPYGDCLGWSKFQMQTEEHVDDLEFTYERVIMTNGLVCYNIITNVAPTMDHFCF